MEWVNFNGYVLDILDDNLVVDYLLDYDGVLLYDEYENKELYIAGGVQVKDKDKFILDFIDFLENNNMRFMGMLGE